MNSRAMILAAVVVIVTGVSWRLMTTSDERTPAPSGPTIATSLLPEQEVPPLPSVDEYALNPEPHRPASTGIDCTRGVACPIIYAPRRER